MSVKQIDVVEKLLRKAVDTANAVEAINFSQAACNAANAVRVLFEIELNSKL